jgi:general secretion pathway protein C
MMFHLSLRIAQGAFPPPITARRNPSCRRAKERKMLQLSLDRSNLPQAAVVVLATVVALVFLGFVAAYWGWALFAPRPEPRAQVSAEAGSGASAGALFGIAQADRNNTVSTGSAIRLLGIVAGTEGRRSYAVLQLESKEILAVTEGEDVAPGIRLAQVGVDHVILERGALREKLAWPEKNAVPESAPMRANH